MEQYTTIEGDTVDLIAWRRYGRTGGTTEAILRVNQGLAAADVKLPGGMVLNVPAVVVEKVIPTKRIWS